LLLHLASHLAGAFLRRLGASLGFPAQSLGFGRQSGSFACRSFLGLFSLLARTLAFGVLYFSSAFFFFCSAFFCSCSLRAAAALALSAAALALSTAAVGFGLEAFGDEVVVVFLGDVAAVDVLGAEAFG